VPPAREPKRAGDAGSHAAIEDLGDVILTPGLVNPHTHLELTCYAGRIPPGPFWPWFQRLLALRREPGALARETAAVVDGAWQSLRAGVTCVGDISRCNVHWRALKPLPIRKVCFVELLSLADHPPRDPRELRAAVEEVEEDALLTVGVTPHAPYTVPAAQVRAAIGLAAELRRPWTMHLAETSEEVAFLRGERGALPRMLEALLEQCGIESPRQGPVEFVQSVARPPWAGPGALSSATVAEEHRRGRLWQTAAASLAHLNYVEDGELDALTATGCVAIYCPRAHSFFGHVPHPFRRMQAAGIPVALGTDSLASNDSLSMLDEMRFVHTQLPDPPSPAELLRMATLEAARALGLAEQIGSLEPGKLSDLAAFPLPPGASDPIVALIDRPSRARALWMGGTRVDRSGFRPR